MSEKAPSRICLTCRTLYDANEECRGKRHRTVSVISQAGRQQLADEVWGPDSRARAMRQAAKAGAGGGTLSGLDWCGGGGCSPFDACEGIGAGGEIGGIIGGIIIVIVGAIVGVALYFIIRTIVRLIREWLHKPIPHGALQAAPTLKKTTGSISGVVTSGAKLESPWRNERSAYAWAMELYQKRVLGGGAMLRDARTAGFSLQLDDGRALRIPAGRIRVVNALAPVADADIAKLEGVVRNIDRARTNEPTVFPFDHARGVMIEDGDRVEVLGDLTPDPEAQGGGYRSNAGGFIPVGVPYLRVEKASKVRVELPTPPPARPEEGGVAEAEAEAIEEEERTDRAAR